MRRRLAGRTRGEDLDTAHVGGPAALYAACEALAIRRIVHISAMGVEDRVTPCDRSKLSGEEMLRQRDLDWTILRPGLVLAPDAYGGTALMRACASLPGVIVAPDGDYAFQTIAAEDLAKIVSAALRDNLASGTINVAGAQVHMLPELLQGLRRWLGLRPAPVIAIPRSMVRLALKFGDFAGWLGWPSGFRTMSLKQIEKGVTGNVPQDGVIAGVAVRSFAATIESSPVSAAQLVAARLYVLRPIVLISLAIFWFMSGAIALGPGWVEANQYLISTGIAVSSAPIVTITTGLLDILIGGALLFRSVSRYALLTALLVSVTYLAGGTALQPDLWHDPLGPLIKIVPETILVLVALAITERR